MTGHSGIENGDAPPVKSLVVVFSYHHKNTEKIANAIAGVLDAPVKTPGQVTPEDLQECDMIGFGSGIYGAKNHGSLIDLAAGLPEEAGRKTFIFSTYGAPAGLYNGERLSEFTRNNHKALREKLEERGCTILDEFSCPGLNTNSFLSLFGGLNKDRPDDSDLRHAREFAESLKRRARFGKSECEGKLP